MNSETFKKLRILILLLILLVVSLDSVLDRVRSTDWDRSLWVGVYPINGDGSTVTDTYIAALTEADFNEIEAYFQQQAKHYGLSLQQPVIVKLAPTLREDIPPPPEGGSALDSILWSLKMRYWAWRHDEMAGPEPDIRLFLRYHDPQKHSQLAHSLGLQKGMVGIVNAFAARDYQGSNRVIVTHELLHTLGALDKYDPTNNLPLFPHGYAEPEAARLYPQRSAEIMGGRIPLSPSRAEIPDSLKQTLVGPMTAREINWITAEG